MSETVYIGLGSNLGDREQFLDQALERLGQTGGFKVTAISAVYASQAEGMADDSPPFLNRVVRGECTLTPEDLLARIEAIEGDLGRTGKGAKLARTIDIDILLFARRTLRTDRLEIPHPRMHRRAFVLVPLLEIDPTLTHPVSGKRLTQHLPPASGSGLEVYRNHVAR